MTKIIFCPFTIPHPQPFPHRIGEGSQAKPSFVPPPQKGLGGGDSSTRKVTVSS